MKIRSTTISFSKGKAQAIRKHEVGIKQQLDKLDKIICNSQNPELPVVVCGQLRYFIRKVSSLYLRLTLPLSFFKASFIVLAKRSANSFVLG